ncbi:MAG: hypothetical protein GX561_09000 [Lentisphaerae bacterium]|jgi:hypothetical protein|nr:hypothetical protein [Lentisphaerota bacterium]
MTLRAFIVGLLTIIFIGAFCFFNDAVLYQNLLIGFHMPMSLFGMLIPLVILVNPCLVLLYKHTRIRLFRPFSGKELCLIFALVLPTCAIPYCSFMRLLPRAAMLPHHYVKTTPSWKLKQEDGSYLPVTELIPKAMLADPDVADGEALNGFVQGLAKPEGANHVRFRDIPWSAWRQTLIFWILLFGLLWLALTGLAFVCHRQWSQNEHLPYPVVQFAQSLFPDEKGSLNSIFKNKLFWISFVIIFVIHINNTLHQYHSDILIPVQRVFNFTPFRVLFPTMLRGGGWAMFWIRLYFSFIAIAYLLPSDVSFGVGLGPFVAYYIMGVMIKFGLSPYAGGAYSPKIHSGMILGGYIGFFATMMYTGRHYYWSVLKSSLGFGVHQETGSLAVWGMRLFFLAAIGLIISMCAIGLDWQLTVLFAILIFICYLVLGRIIAETGMFYLSPGVYPCVILIALMGEQSFGPVTLVIMFILTTLLFSDTRETYMPYIVNAVKFVDLGGRDYRRYSKALLVAMCVSLLVAVPAGIYFSYDGGTNWRDGFATSSVPRGSINSMLSIRTSLQAQGILEQAESVSGFARFANMKPNKQFLITFGIAFLGVLLFSAGRLRYSSWPIHPILFCAWPNYAAYMTCWSFVIGGIIKVLVTRFGGSKSYQRIKPLMFGMIAGDMLAGLVIIASGFIYYLVTNESPKPYYVLPP